MDADNKTKKQVGAPKQMEGGKRHNVYLDDITVKDAMRLGNGNLSEGLRVAVAECSEDEKIISNG